MNKLPTLFVGHGSPLNIVADNSFTQELKAWGKELRTAHQITAILCISAHWRTRGPALTSQEHPPTIHDFGNFPEELYGITYPAPGSTSLVRRVQQLIPDAVADGAWGLDHGAWSVLVHLFPDATVPVVQLSLDKKRSPSGHWDLGTRLRPLRDEGVLILGSGNIVHNFLGLGDPEGAAAHPLGVEFLTHCKPAIVQRNRKALCGYKELGAAAQFSAPTNEHYVPLLYPLAAADAQDVIEFRCDGFQYGTISMLSFAVRTP